MDSNLQKILNILSRGGLVAWPTDTTWGLLAAGQPAALEKIYSLKGRPRGKPLQLLVSSLDVAAKLADTSSLEPAWSLLTSRFWPGALTLVVPATPYAPAELTFSGKIGLRLPADDQLRQLLAAAGGWLAATSLNRSNQAPVRSYQEAVAFAEEVAYIHPGQSGNTASSVFELPEGRLLRSGAIPPHQIAAALEESWTKS